MLLYLINKILKMFYVKIVLFNKKKIKLLYKQDMTDFLTSIYNAESDYISKNRTKLRNNNSVT